MLATCANLTIRSLVESVLSRPFVIGSHAENRLLPGLLADNEGALGHARDARQIDRLLDEGPVVFNAACGHPCSAWWRCVGDTILVYVVGGVARGGVFRRDVTDRTAIPSSHEVQTSVMYPRVYAD